VNFILGGFDTEMKEIETILKSKGYTIEYAKKNGNRVQRREAYLADSPKPKAGQVWIECSHLDYTKKEMKSLGIEVVDHHNPGDPGYGRSPLEYFESSSIGQMHQLIGLKATERSKLIAAADHCLRLAYESQCPGIDRDTLRDFRLAFYKHHNPMDMMRKVKSAIVDCPDIEINGSIVKDISLLPKKYNMWLTEVSCYWGLRTFKLTKKDKGYKAFLVNLSALDIQHFIDTQCHKFGVVSDVYGDPRRQFAGCFYSDIYGNRT